MLGVIFVLRVQPIMVIRSLIFTVLIYSLYLYWNIRRFWFRYIILLVLIRGVLVVFTYIISVLPNESFEISRLLVLIFSLILIYNNNFYEEFIQDIRLGRIKIWEIKTIVLSLFLVVYLLFIIIIVVWLRVIERGAIRIS